jgi:HEPN domain-containing protein
MVDSKRIRDWLIKQCVKFDDDFGNYKPASVNLNKYYIRTRYPADFPMLVSEDEARNAIKVAEEILDLIRNKIVL